MYDNGGIRSNEVDGRVGEGWICREERERQGFSVLIFRVEWWRNSDKELKLDTITCRELESYGVC